jgi:hypothetical protein
MLGALGLVVIFIIHGFGVFSHGFKTKQIRTDDILLDGRIYREVGHFKKGLAGESDPEDQEHPLRRLYKSVMGFWKGKTIKHHSKHGKPTKENKKTSELKEETFNFHSQFQWHHEKSQHPKFQSNPPAYKPKYSFKSKQEKFFEQRHRS